MSARTIDNPGVELVEIDRSSYDKVDNSLPNSPTSLVIGFADRGQDMTLEWIDSKDTLDYTFGKPTTEFESYMYNAICEILNRGGTCIASKLPYENAQFGHYNCIEFDISELRSLTTLTGNADYAKIGDIHDSLQDVLNQLDLSSTDITSIAKMAQAIVHIIKTYAKAGASTETSTIGDLSARLSEFITAGIATDSLFPLHYNDPSITSYLDVKLKPISHDPDEYGISTSIDDLDDLMTGHKSIIKGTMRIYDITRSKYQSVSNYSCVSSDALSAFTNECLGIVPVVVTPANAIYFQNLMQSQSEFIADNEFSAFNSVSGYASMHHSGITQVFDDEDDNVSSHVSLPIASASELSDMNLFEIDSVSRTAASYFPPVNYYTENQYDKTNLKKVGIVVFRSFKDTSNSGKIGFQPLEAFVGSFDKNARDEITHANIFIDNVVNQSSQFIRVFSNVDLNTLQKASTIGTSLQKAVAMGFYREDCAKDISYQASIMQPLTRILDKAVNPNVVPVDIIVDAGMSNIAQLAKQSSTVQDSSKLPDSTSLTALHTDYFPYIADYSWQFNSSQHDITGWRAVLSKVDTFCKSARKDCMFIADGIRPLCLDGNQKIVRATAPQNTVTNNIIPNFRYIAHTLDSSYSCGYCNWFYQQDYSSPSNYFWCPPSIKAMGVCIYCDTYFHPWSAPAGTTRGIIGDAVDVAFLPTDSEAGVIYSNSWNYAMSYPIDGIVIEGHKTFQTQRTALDRINVRRLMLSLEKQVAAVARTFVYEQNTDYTRQQFVDRIEPILESAVAGSGIQDYAIRCDETLNTAEVIENNEMRCKIAVKPVKCVDYLVLDFICSNQSADVTEEVMR